MSVQNLHPIRRVVGVLIAGMLMSCGSGVSPQPEVIPPTVSPIHVFLFIGDGMGRSSEIAASRYLYGEDEGLVWNSFPVRTWASTWDVTTYNSHANAAAAAAWAPTSSDPLLGYDPAIGGTEPWKPGAVDALSYYKRGATDSASAATAIATGMKTDSGNIAWASGDLPDGELETIAELMRSRRGSAIGIVSTVPFNHATPASFVAHSTNRDSYAAIADEIIGTTKPEVVIGGGHPDSTSTYFSHSGLEGLRGSEYWTLVEFTSSQDGGAKLLDAAATLPTGKGLFGLFGSRSDGAFEASVPTSVAGTPDFTRGTDDPTLAIAVQVAATGLPRFPSSAFMMKGERPIRNPAAGAQWDYAGGTLTYSSTGHGNELVGLAVMGDEAQVLFGSSIMDNTAIYSAIVHFAGLQ